MNDREDRIAALQQALGDRDLAIRVAKERLAESVAQLESHHAENRELAERLSALGGHATELDAALKSADAKVRDLLAEEVRRDAFRRKLGEEVRAREARIERLLVELRSKIGHLNELETSAETQRGVLNRLQEDLLMAKAVVQKREQRIHNLTKAVARLKRDHRRLAESPGWRIAAPLMAISLLPALARRSADPGRSRPNRLPDRNGLTPKTRRELGGRPHSEGSQRGAEKGAVAFSPLSPRGDSRPGGVATSIAQDKLADNAKASKAVLNALLLKANEAMERCEWSNALTSWQDVLWQFGTKEAPASLSRFNISILNRLIDSDRYREQIDAYVNSRKERTPGALRIAIYTAIVGEYDTLKLHSISTIGLIISYFLTYLSPPAVCSM